MAKETNARMFLVAIFACAILDTRQQETDEAVLVGNFYKSGFIFTTVDVMKTMIVQSSSPEFKIVQEISSFTIDFCYMPAQGGESRNFSEV